MIYLYRVLEKHTRTLENIANRPFSGLEIFTDTNTFIDRLTSLTVGAVSVCTINLSDIPVTYKPLKTYFDKVHRYISESKDFHSFHRIIGLDNLNKVLWLMKTSSELMQKSNLYVAFADIRTRTVHVIDLCFQIIERNDGWYTFIFSSVDINGKMPAILINNEHYASAMKVSFNSLWDKLPHLHKYQKIEDSAFGKLEEWFPDLLKNAEYTALKQKMIKDTS